MHLPAHHPHALLHVVALRYFRPEVPPDAALDEGLSFSNSGDSKRGRGASLYSIMACVRNKLTRPSPYRRPWEGRSCRGMVLSPHIPKRSWSPASRRSAPSGVKRPLEPTLFIHRPKLRLWPDARLLPRRTAMTASRFHTGERSVDQVRWSLRPVEGDRTPGFSLPGNTRMRPSCSSVR